MYAQRIDQDLYRVLIPFQDLTTTVYIAVFEEGTAIIDSGTYPSDVDEYILPALAELGATASVRFLLLTHHHSDHAGGFARLSDCFPQAESALPEGLEAIALPGHTADAVGYLDHRSETLLSGDCLQLRGIGKYRNGIGDKAAYIRSVETLKKRAINRIVAAHEYDPLGSLAEGEKAVQEYLDLCIKIANEQ